MIIKIIVRATLLCLVQIFGIIILAKVEYLVELHNYLERTEKGGTYIARSLAHSCGQIASIENVIDARKLSRNIAIPV